MSGNMHVCIFTFRYASGTMSGNMYVSFLVYVYIMICIYYTFCMIHVQLLHTTASEQITKDFLKNCLVANNYCRFKLG